MPPTDHHRNEIIDFMAYARKLSIKKQNLKTYNDFFICLWSTFSFLFKSRNQVDIVFDVYREKTIKESERRWRTTGEGIETIISGFDQPPPVEIDQFWSVSRNKTALQQLLQVKNLINSYSKVVHIKITMRCVLALSMGWLKLWFLIRGYPKWLIHTEVEKVKFSCTSRKRDTKMKGIPLVITYHPLLKDFAGVIRKHLYILYMNK